MRGSGGNSPSRRRAAIAVMALVAAALAWVFIVSEMNQRRCARLAQAQGFLESEYVAPANFSDGRCIGKKRRNSDGSIDATVQAAIAMPD